ncbi:MAG: undecaprenyl diphosphate synthase family protein [Candidatus Njordarchaeales archaeon]
MHLAVILDGNRRFSKRLGIGIEEGYKISAKKVEELINWFISNEKIKILSLYSLSVLNFYNRPKYQLKILFNIFHDKLIESLDKMLRYKGKVRVQILSLIERKLPKKIRKIIRQVNKTMSRGDKTINFLFGYDSQLELERALKLSKKNGKPLRENLLVKEPVDLLVRTGNEKRLSGFLLYQSSQAQIYFEKRMFPETNRRVWNWWIRWFEMQERRFGR